MSTSHPDRQPPAHSPEPLLSIGEFARASLLSVKALRNYHEAGILLPARVDPSTGYRSYHVGQLTDAAVLRRLRGLDLPLADVRRVLDARDPQVTAAVLAAHATVMQARLADVEQAVARLTESLAHPAEHTPVHVRDDPAQLTLQVTGTAQVEEYAAFLGEAYGRLWQVLTSAGLQPAGPGGALYPTAQDDEAEVTAFVPVDRDVALPVDRGPVSYGEVPAARVAVLTHHGSYDEIGDSYRLLGAWVAANATSADGPAREVYVTGPMDTPDASGYRTEICWPVGSPSTAPGAAPGTPPGTTPITAPGAAPAGTPTGS